LFWLQAGKFALQNIATMNKRTLLNQLAEQTEAHLQKAIEQWQMLPHSSFARMPGAAAWSANQCLQHLNSYGLYYLPKLEKALQQAPAQPADADFAPGWMGAWFTRMMQIDSATQQPSKKMKAPKPHTPVQILPSHEVIAEFIDQQERLLQMLQKAAHLDLAAVRIPISIASFIRLKAGDVLSFLVAHNERHVQQALRALQAQPTTTLVS
jgi:hypothetical protein